MLRLYVIVNVSVVSDLVCGIAIRSTYNGHTWSSNYPATGGDKEGGCWLVGWCVVCAKPCIESNLFKSYWITWSG